MLICDELHVTILANERCTMCSNLSKMFATKTAEDEMFDWTYQDFNAEKTFASADSLSGSILAGPLADVAAHFSDSRNLTIRFENLSTACVDKDKLVEYVTSEQWKPNVEDPRLDWPGPSCAGRQAFRESTLDSHFQLREEFSKN